MAVPEDGPPFGPGIARVKIDDHPFLFSSWVKLSRAVPSNIRCSCARGASVEAQAGGTTVSLRVPEEFTLMD